MRFRSLRTELLVWLVVPLALYAAASTWFAHRNAAETATVVHDRLLLGSAKMIGEQIHDDDGALQVTIPPAALELFQSGEEDRIYYRIDSARGTLLLGYGELPLPRTKVEAEDAIYYDALFRGEPVRAVAFAQPVFTAPAEEPVLIVVAQTLHSRNSLTRQFWVQAAQQQFVLLALALVMLIIGLRRGLLPLLELRERMQRRRPGTLDRLDAALVPGELVPLVAAINDYDRRLDDYMSAHSRFIANASHQLHTPLTLLNTQVNFALRSTDAESRDEALRAIHDGVQHGIRVVNQLLTLSSAESPAGHSFEQSEVDLVAIVQNVLEELATIAQSKKIDLGFELSGGPTVVRAMPWMLRELVANLVDNALRYTPDGGVVTAAVSVQNKLVVFRVSDNGPGIPEEEHERVFERFYRLRQDRSDGCGLGLSIVREIATAIHAKVSLSSASERKGLVVTVLFPGHASGIVESCQFQPLARAAAGA